MGGCGASSGVSKKGRKYGIITKIIIDMISSINVYQYLSRSYAETLVRLQAPVFHSLWAVFLF